MKITNLICLLLLSFMAASPRVHGAPFRTDINPALLYYQAFLMAPALQDTKHDYLLTNNWQGKQLPEQFGSLVSYYDQEMKYLHQAAAQKFPCVWGIDLTPGPEALLPELAHCKRAAVVTRLHVMWELQKGNEAAACDDLIGAFVLGRNSAHDGTLIANLVQFAIENIVFTTAAENFQHLNPETLEKLSAGFATAPERGTIVDCLSSERYSNGRWLRGQIEELQAAHPNDESAVMDDLKILIDRIQYEGQTNYWTELTNGAGGTVAGLIKMTQQSEIFYDELTRIMALPHGEFEDRIVKFSDEVKKSGDYLTADALGAWPSSRRKEFTTQVQQAMVQAAIAYKLHGDDGFKSIMDPLGNGPFTMERFVYQGEDRGFELKSAYAPIKEPMAMIFVEKDGPAFNVQGIHVGEAPAP